mgnify:CR=1 FL=1
MDSVKQQITDELYFNYNYGEASNFIDYLFSLSVKKRLLRFTETKNGPKLTSLYQKENIGCNLYVVILYDEGEVLIFSKSSLNKVSGLNLWLCNNIANNTKSININLYDINNKNFSPGIIICSLPSESLIYSSEDYEKNVPIKSLIISENY